MTSKELETKIFYEICDTGNESYGFYTTREKPDSYSYTVHSVKKPLYVDNINSLNELFRRPSEGINYLTKQGYDSLIVDKGNGVLDVLVLDKSKNVSRLKHLDESKYKDDSDLIWEAYCS